MLLYQLLDSLVAGAITPVVVKFNSSTTVDGMKNTNKEHLIWNHKSSKIQNSIIIRFKTLNGKMLAIKCVITKTSFQKKQPFCGKLDFKKNWFVGFRVWKFVLLYDSAWMCTLVNGWRNVLAQMGHLREVWSMKRFIFGLL